MKKIIQLCQFSSGCCGVFSRVLQDSKELVKRGYEVWVFSSNQVKGKPLEIAKNYEVIDGINIRRFPTSFQIGENCLFWDFITYFNFIQPDIVIAHCYRHPYTNKIIKYSKRQNIRTILITHAPFVGRKLRGLKLHMFTVLYDWLFSKYIFNSFDKIVRITNWEIPYLEKLGCNKSVYIPNGIPDKFFDGNIKQGKGLLFLGRIAPVKNIECLINAIRDINIQLNIVGPYEEEYYNMLQNLCCDGMALYSKAGINFLPPVYDIQEKIKLIDNHEIFILPSKREGMPQSLIEAMARGKIVIASDTDGAKEIIKDNFNGFLFKNGDTEDLKNHIEFILKLPNIEKLQIRNRARKSVEQFKISKLIDKLEDNFK